MAERFLRAHFGAEVQNHRIFAIVSDGDLMEGIAAEAASLAGKLGLGRIVYLYDDNDISLDGPTDLSFDTEDVAKRFDAYGWHVQTVDDANDLGALEVAIDQAMREEERPSLIRVKSIIGWPSPNKQGTSKAHGSPLGEDEVRLTKEVLGWDPDEHFVVPDEVREHFDQRARGAALQAEWDLRYRDWRAGHDELAAQWDAAWAGRPLPGVREALREHRLGEGQARHALGRPEGDGRLRGLRADDGRRRRRPQRVDQDRVPGRPRAQLQAGAPGAQRLLRRARARHGRRGQRHGRPRRDRAPVRLDVPAVRRLHARLGAPVGRSWASRSPGSTRTTRSASARTARPTSPSSTSPRCARSRAWWSSAPATPTRPPPRGGRSSRTSRGPAALILSRQDLPILPDADFDGVARGAYVLRGDDDPEVAIVGTGSELSVAIGAAELLTADGVRARVVSMPSWELFAAQDDAYRDSVLPPGLPAVAVEAGVSRGWDRWVDRVVGDRPLRRQRARASGPREARDHGGAHRAGRARAPRRPDRLAPTARAR